MHNEVEDIKKYVYEVQPKKGNKEPIDKKYRSIFLAGTIDMGGSRNWQDEHVKFFENNYKGCKDLYIFNPRRDTDFPKETDPYFEREFDYQVNWELDHLEKADIIIMNILGTSKSPISLMELGAFGRGLHKKIYVICPKEFYRYGNVRIFCERYGITLFNDESIFLDFMKNTFLQN